MITGLIPTPKKQEYIEIYSSLSKVVESETASNLVEEISRQVHSIQKNRKRGVTAKLRAAVAAIIADLLAVPPDAGEEACTYRPVGAAAFVGCAIGHKAFNDTIAAMETLGLANVVKGSRWYQTNEANPKASQFRPTQLLRERAEAYGIYTGNLHFHFKRQDSPSKISNPVELREASKKKYDEYGDKVCGKKVWFDKTDPLVSAYAKQMNDLNDFIEGFNIVGCEVNGFRRVFGNADKGGRAFNQGGRIYPVAPSYQNLSKVLRSDITIDGEPTKEVDVKCSQLYVYLSLKGVAFDPEDDGYAIPGILRDAVKAFMTQTFGSAKLPCRWSSGQRKRYAEKGAWKLVLGLTGDLSKDFPLEVVKEAVLDKYPVFAGWEHDSIKWGQLQFRESEPIVAAMDELRKRGIPSLPVHDSLIVPVSKASVAVSVIKAMYKHHLGFEPRVE